MANIYIPDTWSKLSESTKTKLLTILSWVDGTNELDDDMDWEGDF